MYKFWAKSKAVSDLQEVMIKPQLTASLLTQLIISVCEEVGQLNPMLKQVFEDRKQTKILFEEESPTSGAMCFLPGSELFLER